MEGQLLAAVERLSQLEEEVAAAKKAEEEAEFQHDMEAVMIKSLEDQESDDSSWDLGSTDGDE